MGKDTNQVQQDRVAYILAVILIGVVGFLYAFVNALFLRPIFWRRLPPLPNGPVAEIVYAYTEYNPSRYCLEYMLYVQNDAGEFYCRTGSDPFVSDGDWEKSALAEIEALPHFLSRSETPCSNYPDPPKVWWRKSLSSTASCSKFTSHLVSRVRHYVLLSNGRVLMAASNDELALLVYPAVGLLILYLIYFIVGIIRGYLHHL